MSPVPFRRICVPVLQAGVFAVLLASPAPATDGNSPSEMPYEVAGEIPSLDPLSYRMNTKAVRITDNSLDPRLVRLEEGQLVAWVSDSPIPSTVVFERDVARSMICHSLVNFSIKEDELRSAPIHAGEFASFCELKPGRYRYKVTRPTPIPGALEAVRRLECEIIVGNPKGG